jgi:hypothetical protein
MRHDELCERHPFKPRQATLPVAIPNPGAVSSGAWLAILARLEPVSCWAKYMDSMG